MIQLFLSLIIPVYNEEERISDTLKTCLRYLRNQSYSSEIIVVDDGSTDNTADLVQKIVSECRDVKLLRLQHKGKGWAVKNGMLAGTGQYRFLADADLSMPIEYIERFLPPISVDIDITIGSRECLGARRFDEPILRHIQGRAFNWAVRALAVRGIKDTQCGFKCFSEKAANLLFPMQLSNGFGFDVEVLFLAQKKRLNINEIPIDWYYREGSKVRPVMDSILMLKDILVTRINDLMGKYKLN